jgi:hypothetical protein
MLDYRTRFRGRITEVQAVETGGLVTEWLVSAVGDQARLGRIQVVLERPAEPDTARAAAILQSAGLPHRVEGQPRVVLGADTINRDALSALHEVTGSSGGLLFQDRDGTIVYRGDVGAPGPTLVLPCSALGDGIDWTQSVTQIINHVTVTWREGVPPDTTEHQWTISDAPSIAGHGVWHADAPTICATQADAATLGAHILARWAQLRWVVPDVVLFPSLLPGAEYRAVQALDVGSVLLVPVDPEPNATPGELAAWVLEGWVEEWSTRPPWGHRIQLALSDSRLRNVLRTWDEVALESWDHWAQGTWLDMLIKEIP